MPVVTRRAFLEALAISLAANMAIAAYILRRNLEYVVAERLASLPVAMLKAALVLALVMTALYGLVRAVFKFYS